MLIVYSIAGIIIAIALALIVMSHHPMFKMTSQTTGQVASSTEREVRDENERREETVVVCSYEVRGQPHTVQRVFRGRKAYKFPVGARLPIRYNPAEPDMATFATENVFS